MKRVEELPLHSEVFDFPHISKESNQVLIDWMEKIYQLVTSQKVSEQEFQTLKTELLSNLMTTIPENQQIISVIDKMLLDRWNRLQSSYQAVEYWQYQVSLPKGFQNLKKGLGIHPNTKISSENINFSNWFVSVKLNHKQMSAYWEAFHRKRNVNLVWDGQDGFVSDELFLEDENGNFCPVIIVSGNDEEYSQQVQMHEMHHVYLHWLIWGEPLNDSKIKELRTIEEAETLSLAAKWFQRSYEKNRSNLVLFVKSVAKKLRKNGLVNFLDELVANIAEGDIIDNFELEALYNTFILDLENIEGLYGNYFSQLLGLRNFIREIAANDQELYKYLWWNVLVELEIYDRQLFDLFYKILTFFANETADTPPLVIANYQFLLTFCESSLEKPPDFDSDFLIDVWAEYIRVIDPSLEVMDQKATWMVNHVQDIHLAIKTCLSEYDLERLPLQLISYPEPELKKTIGKDLAESLSPLFTKMSLDLDTVFLDWRNGLLSNDIQRQHQMSEQLLKEMTKVLKGYDFHLILSACLSQHFDEYVFPVGFFDQHGSRDTSVMIISQYIAKMATQSILARYSISQRKKI